MSSFGHCCIHMDPFKHSCGIAAKYCSGDNPCSVSKKQLTYKAKLLAKQVEHGKKSNTWREP